MLVFPEGQCTNNSAMLPFKKGAFYGVYAVEPMVLKYGWNTVSPTYECIEYVPLVIM